MALIDKLTAIGDAIRGKEGTTEPIPLNDMATRITNLPSGGGNSTGAGHWYYIDDADLEWYEADENGQYTNTGECPKCGCKLSDINNVSIKTYCPYCHTYINYNEGVITLVTEPTDEELLIGGNQQYRFAGGEFDWVIEKYGNRITTKNLTDCSYMFQYSTVENIPFQFNFETYGGKIGYMFVGCSNLKQIAGEMDVKQTSSAQSSSSVFKNCGKLIAAPKILNLFPNSIDGFFSCCYNLRNLPDDYFDSWNFSKTIDYNYASARQLFNECYSLRSIPKSLLNGLTNHLATSSSYHFYNEFAKYCYALDEITDFPVTTTAVSSNLFSAPVLYCTRLKNFTFAMNEDGTPKTTSWKNQTIDLSSVGYIETNMALAPNTIQTFHDSYDKVTLYNSGITTDKFVYDDATYQALKDDPDWYTAYSYSTSNEQFNKPYYSRYNHDSAVATINSLPDTSAYGTNTIKFKGEAGSKTDGGAINTLTEEEIAVAAAKGWTVTLV